MTWKGNPRTSTPAHRNNRRVVFARDHGICHVCGKPGADELDHISPWSTEAPAGRVPDRLDNLAPIHKTPCHKNKTATEASAARWRHKASRPPEQHPGMR